MSRRRSSRRRPGVPDTTHQRLVNYSQLRNPLRLQAAFSQEVGALGEIVETQFGYHVIEVTQKNEAQTRSLEDVKDALAEDLLNRKRGEAFQTTIEGLKAAADITYPAAP